MKIWKINVTRFHIIILNVNEQMKKFNAKTQVEVLNGKGNKIKI